MQRPEFGDIKDYEEFREEIKSENAPNESKTQLGLL